jgi:hydroxymethylpyrimidine pyrophosphatase-like HAD family hydrolase
MSAYFIDLDGTFFKWGTQEPLPGAVETVQRLEAEGNMIVWTTLRDPQDPVKGYPQTIRAFRELGIKSEAIIWGCPSPRIVVNDDGAFGVNVEQNGPMTYESIARHR